MAEEHKALDFYIGKYSAQTSSISGIGYLKMLCRDSEAAGVRL